MLERPECLSTPFHKVGNVFLSAEAGKTRHSLSTAKAGGGGGIRRGESVRGGVGPREYLMPPSRASSAGKLSRIPALSRWTTLMAAPSLARKARRRRIFETCTKAGSQRLVVTRALVFLRREGQGGPDLVSAALPMERKKIPAWAVVNSVCELYKIKYSVVTYAAMSHTG
jgi:hypothetical protein